MINLLELYSRIGYDPAFALDLVDGFVGDAKAILAEAEAGISSSDLTRLAASAHNLKGAAQNLAVDAVAAPALVLERAAKGGELQRSREALAAVQEAVVALEAFIKTPGWAELPPEQQAAIDF